MRRKLIFIAPLAILGILLFVFIGGEVVQLLWNWLLPPLFGWRQITFWQALGLLALCRILFGGFGGHGFCRSNSRHRTPEERERFRQAHAGTFRLRPIHQREHGAMQPCRQHSAKTDRVKSSSGSAVDVEIRNGGRARRARRQLLQIGPQISTSRSPSSAIGMRPSSSTSTGTAVSPGSMPRIFVAAPAFWAASRPPRTSGS